MEPLLPLRLWRAFRGSWPIICLSGGAALVAAAAEALAIVLVTALLGAFSQGVDPAPVELGMLGEPLVLPVATLFGITLVGVTVRLCAALGAALATASAVGTYEQRKRNDLFQAFLEAEWAVQAQEGEGELHTIASQILMWCTRCMKSMVKGVSDLGSATLLIAAAALLDPPLVFVLVAATVVLFFVLRPMSTVAKNHAEVATGLLLTYSHQVNQLVHLARDVRTYDAGDASSSWAAETNERYRRQRVISRILAGLQPALYLNMALVLIAAGVGALSLMGVSSVSAIAVLLLLFRAMKYTQRVQNVYHTVREGLPYLDRLDNAIDAYRERRDAPTEGARPGAPARLRLDGVGFHYPGTELPALQPMSLEVPGGSAVGIVGPSGSGKSTLVQLLTGLRRPTTGAVFFDDTNMEQIARSALPKLVRYVPQEALLLDDTVAANIRFFRDLDDEAVRRAAKRARIHDEIEAMAHGYQTQVGDRGGALSGGQRQRICIARSLVEPAPVLVMDEPTSALDVQSEARVHETLSSLIGTGIVFVVAHRLTTIAMCDRLLVLEGGRVTDYGPAAEVAARNAWFSSVLATGAAAAGASPGAG